jgi:hypothetical protein
MYAMEKGVVTVGVGGRGLPPYDSQSSCRLIMRSSSNTK